MAVASAYEVGDDVYIAHEQGMNFHQHASITTSNGTVIVAHFREDAHSGYGNVTTHVSWDNGTTWNVGSTILQRDGSLGACNPAIGLAPNGTVVVMLQMISSGGGTQGLGLFHSYDNGLSWVNKSWVNQTNSNEILHVNHIFTLDNIMYIAPYNNDRDWYIYTSVDNGFTWNYKSTIWDSVAGDYSYSALAYLSHNNSFIWMCHNTNNNDRNWHRFSEDNCTTWSGLIQSVNSIGGAISIRDPDIVEHKGIYFLHGRERIHNASRWFSFYTSTDCLFWTNLTGISDEDDHSAYSSSFVIGNNLYLTFSHIYDAVNELANLSMVPIYFNTNPVFSNPNPANKSTGQQLTLTWNITIEDSDGDTFNWTIECSNGNTSSANGETNGSKELSITGLSLSANYTIWVNATDETDTTNETFWFVTKNNQALTSTNPSPANKSTGINNNTDISIDLTDLDGDYMSYELNLLAGGAVSGSTYNATITLNDNNLEHNTNYTWWFNASDGTVSINESYWFITKSNIAPAVSLVEPLNDSVGISFDPVLVCNISDQNGDTLSGNFQTNSSGTWQNIGTFGGVGNCTVHTNTNVFNVFQTLFTKYWWSMNLSDGTVWTNETYTFTTRGNTLPVISEILPTNKTTDWSVVNTILSFTLMDVNGDYMPFNTTTNISATFNQSGSWIENGTYYLDLLTLQPNTNYTWWINVTDYHYPASSGFIFGYTNETYWFVTAPNTPVNIALESPTNQTVNVSLSVNSVSVAIEDIDGNDMNWSIETSWGESVANINTMEAVTRGLAGGTDALTNSNVSSVIKVWQGVTNYTVATDYIVSGDYIDWSPGGIEPAPATTYYVTYWYDGSPENGTIYCNWTNALSYSTNYTWWVNATDGIDWTNATYWFVTVDEPAAGDDDADYISAKDLAETVSIIYLSIVQLLITISFIALMLFMMGKW